jgi:hypothetical protein
VALPRIDVEHCASPATTEEDHGEDRGRSDHRGA